MLHCQNRFVSGQAMISSSLQGSAKAASRLLIDCHQDDRMTRRSTFGLIARRRAQACGETAKLLYIIRL